MFVGLCEADADSEGGFGHLDCRRRVQRPGRRIRYRGSASRVGMIQRKLRGFVAVQRLGIDLFEERSALLKRRCAIRYVVYDFGFRRHSNEASRRRISFFLRDSFEYDDASDDPATSKPRVKRGVLFKHTEIEYVAALKTKRIRAPAWKRPERSRLSTTRINFSTLYRFNVAVNMAPRAIDVLLFDDFEMLDVFGPLEIFATAEKEVPGSYVINCWTIENPPSPGVVRSSGGPSVLVTGRLDGKTFQDLLRNEPESRRTLLLPGGHGIRRLVDDRECIRLLVGLFSTSGVRKATICTGSALLSKTKLLNQRRATSNKRSWDFVVEQNLKVRWVESARWIRDGSFWTSSGVAAGTDMALEMVRRDLGEKVAKDVAFRIEYIENPDANDDPFAKAARM